jgi:flagellar hook-associated protein 3 FlgL
MRIATSQYQSMMNTSLQKNQERISHITSQMASGKRIELPSDDPVDSVRLSRLKREEASIGQYRDNIAAVSQRMTKNEGYLTNMVNDLATGRDLLVWAADGSNAPADLNAMVTSLTSLRDSLMYTSNTLDQEGRYVFSGTLTDTAPIAFDPAAAPGSRYSYAGNNNNQDVIVGNGITQVANQNVNGIEAMLNRLDEMIVTLGDPAVNINDPTTRSVVMGGLDDVDAAMGLLSGKVAVLGGQQNILKTIDANHASISLSNQVAILDIGQLDVGAAAVDLSGYTTALQASYKAYSKIGNLSLFAVL